MKYQKAVGYFTMPNKNLAAGSKNSHQRALGAGLTGEIRIRFEQMEFGFKRLPS